MIPLGVLGSARVPAAGGGPLTLTYTDTDFQSGNLATYTYTGVDIGTASADRIVVVAASTRKAPPSPTLSSMTIGGVSATIDSSAGTSSGNLVVIGRAAIPTGTTTTVSFTYSATVLRSGIGVWTITGGDVTATGYDGTGNTDASAVVTVPTDGCAICAVMTTNAGSVAWTNATERYDQVIEAAGHSGADTSTPGSPTITATGTGANDMTLAIAAYGPA